MKCNICGKEFSPKVCFIHQQNCKPIKKEVKKVESEEIKKEVKKSPVKKKVK